MTQSSFSMKQIDDCKSKIWWYNHFVFNSHYQFFWMNCFSLSPRHQICIITMSYYFNDIIVKTLFSYELYNFMKSHFARHQIVIKKTMNFMFFQISIFFIFFYFFYLFITRMQPQAMTRSKYIVGNLNPFLSEINAFYECLVY